MSRVVGLTVGAVVSAAVAVEDVLSGFDAQQAAGWVVGSASMVALGWRIWTERGATERADAALEARVTDKETELTQLRIDRDYWRDMYMGKHEPRGPGWQAMESRNEENNL